MINVQFPLSNFTLYPLRQRWPQIDLSEDVTVLSSSSQQTDSAKGLALYNLHCLNMPWAVSVESVGRRPVQGRLSH